MSKKNELLKALKKLKELNLSELKFLEKDNLDLKDLEHFREKKIKLRNLIDSHLKLLELNEEEKISVVAQFKELLQLEDRVGEAYKKKLINIQDGLIHINTERKLRETYGKGGMNFLTIEDKDLK